MNNNQIKISVFDFKQDWNLVEPHLNDPEILGLFTSGMLMVSIDHKRDNLPLWNPENKIGPWQYSLGDAHVSYAIDKTNEDPQFKALVERYSEICENEGIEFESIFYETEEENQKIQELFSNYWADVERIQEKYFPQRNTYRWYQCYNAGYYLHEWQMALAKQVFPDFEWRLFLAQGDNPDSFYLTHIGKGPNQHYIIFDIICFDIYSADRILDDFGLNRSSLENEWAAGISKPLFQTLMI